MFLSLLDYALVHRIEARKLVAWPVLLPNKLQLLLRFLSACALMVCCARQGAWWASTWRTTCTARLGTGLRASSRWLCRRWRRS